MAENDDEHRGDSRPGDESGPARREQAEDRRDWAKERTLFAKQRTVAARLRTGLLPVAVGSAAAEFLGDLDSQWLVKSASSHAGLRSETGTQSLPFPLGLAERPDVSAPSNPRPIGVGPAARRLARPA